VEGVYFTRGGMRKLDDRLDAHDEEVRSLLKQLGEACADDPDLPENSLSKEIRAKFHGEMPAEKQRLLGMKVAAVIVENSREFMEKPEDTIWIGSEVAYCNIKDKTDVTTLTILGALESDISKNIISYNAPIAAAMMNKKVGETFGLSGSTFEIISVRRVLDKERE
jgi:transcription elongation GreA/GreB family factor